jgi:hypothetical protein
MDSDRMGAAIDMDRILTLADFRPFLQIMFPSVEDDRDDDDPYEHPMTAVGLVLMSAATMGTTEPMKLILFTGYSRAFIAAITLNMQNNRLWVDGRYDVSTWLSQDGNIDADCLWTHIEFAGGNMWMPTADPDRRADPCMVYWNERGGYGKGGK